MLLSIFVTPILLLAALLKNRKLDNAKDKANDKYNLLNKNSSLQTKKSDEKLQKNKKNKDFLKDNIGIIIGICQLPHLIEEAKASINASKLAKNVLNEKDLKHLNKLNAKAWSTYLLGAIAISGLAQFAVYIKDKVVEKN